MADESIKNCIFCKIVKGDMPSSKIYENNNVFSFLDISPVNKGHALVIPKKHYETLLNIPDDLLGEVAKVAKKVAKAVIKATDTDGFNICQNNGKTGGQLVPHFHLHVIPRYKEDGLKPWPQSSYKEGEMQEIAKKIVKFL